MGWCVDGIDVAQDRDNLRTLSNAVIRKPAVYVKCRNFFTSYGAIRFLRRTWS
jgi:hypothetical protein